MMARCEATTDPAPPADARPLYCRRCGNPRPLGIVGGGRFWSRQGGRTIVAEGGTVHIRCERCGAEHEVDLSAD